MERIVRISKVEEQDKIRREDSLKMSPEERMLALMAMRDRMFPYQPLERIVTIRQIH